MKLSSNSKRAFSSVVMERFVAMKLMKNTGLLMFCTAIWASMPSASLIFT